MISRRTPLHLCSRLGVPGLLLRCTRRMRPRWITVLAYHRVAEVAPDTPWDTEVISASPETFRRQMAFVRRHFTCITSREIQEWKHGRAVLPPNPLVITFDDGYRDNHDTALPILQEAGMVGEFFVCPWNIGQRRLFWWDRIAYAVRRTRRTALRLDYPAPLSLDLSSPAAAHAAWRTLLRTVKNTAGMEIERFLHALEESAGVALDETRAAEALIMTWDHVRALHRAGMTIGSHSYSHPILSLGEREAVRMQMTRSKQEIETALGAPICSIAYPVGRFSAETKELAAQAGYEVAYSYCSGATRVDKPDFYEIRRVDVDRRRSLDDFRMVVALPFLL